MPIEFEAPKPIAQTQFVLKTIAEEMMRPRSRYFDEHEHEIPWDYIEFMHSAMKAMGGNSLAPRENGNGNEKEKDAETEATTFLGVTEPKIEGMKCASIGDNKVKCDGKITARFPPIKILSGDRFISLLGCLNASPKCSVTFGQVRVAVQRSAPRSRTARRATTWPSPSTT